MRPVFFALAMVTLAEGFAYGAAPELLVEGNRHLSDRTIVDSAAGLYCPASDSECVEGVCRLIAGLYWESGYLDAVVECERLRPGADTIRVFITEGNPSALREVQVLGSEVLGRSDLVDLFEDGIGLPFSPARLEEGIRRLLELYDQRGYPAATVRPEMVRAGDGWLEVVLRVDEGRRAVLGNVVFSGLGKTRRETALAVSGVSVGDVYDGKVVEEVPARLMAWGVFEEVSGPVLSFGPGDSVVTVAFEVVEARANRLEGVVAYAPSREEGNVVGSLDLELGNIGGTLRRLRVVYDRPGPERLRWRVLYREPRVVGLPVALDAAVASDVLEDSYAHRNLSLRLGFRRGGRLELGLGGSVGVIKERGPVTADGDFTERAVSFDFRYEGRDRPANPRSGQVLSLVHEISSLDFEQAGSRDRTLTSLGFEVECVLDAIGDNVLTVGARFTGIYSSREQVPPSHRVRLGGAGSLRGYPEEWFSVEEALVLTFETRHLVGLHSRIYAFIDGATFQNENRGFGDLDQLPYGYGFGFIGGSRSGCFRLEIALGRSDDLSDAKLHLGLETTW